MALALPSGAGTVETPGDVAPELAAEIGPSVAKVGWRMLVGPLFVHLVDTRPGLLAKLAGGLFDHLPSRARS